MTFHAKNPKIPSFILTFLCIIGLLNRAPISQWWTLWLGFRTYLVIFVWIFYQLPSDDKKII